MTTDLYYQAKKKKKKKKKEYYNSRENKSIYLDNNGRSVLNQE